MNLAIDIGNTAVKAGWFEGDSLVAKQDNVTVDDLKQQINEKKPSFVIGSSTATELFEDQEWKKTNIISVNHKLNFPFEVKYKTPETLGADRLAAVAGGQSLFPEDHILIIDAGTCITYEFLNSKKEYLGGVISPGVNMRFRSMGEFTARLPRLKAPTEFPEILGTSTTSCMESGVMNGVFYEMQKYIDWYTANNGKIIVVLTGGDAKYFEKKLKGDIFAAPDLVLIGLNVILQYNEANF